MNVDQRIWQESGVLRSAMALIIAALLLVPVGVLAQEASTEVKLTAADASAGDAFSSFQPIPGPASYALSISGDTVVVGAAGDDDLGLDSGSAYVFVRTGTTWAQQAKLTASDGDAGDLFGRSVAVSGDTVIVGASHDDDAGLNSGSAYVFVRTGTTWAQQAKLPAVSRSAQDRFGIHVAVEGDTAVVGATGDDHHAGAFNAGSAYVFVRTGMIWAQQAKLMAPDAASFSGFGFTVAIDGDTIAIDADGTDHSGLANAGAVYVFVRSGSFWSFEAKLTANDAAENDFFGFPVSISGDTIAMGACCENPVGPGSATAPGAAYVFVRSGTTWSQQAKLVASDATNQGYMGDGVAVSGDTVIVGADRKDGTFLGQGAVYVFRRFGSTWTEVSKLTASDAAEDDFFGYPVVFSGDFFAIGAVGDDDGGAAAGAVYVFNIAGEVTSQTLVHLAALVESNLQTPLADKAEDAIATLGTALDELNKTPPDNQAAVGNIESAVGSLETAVIDGLLDPAEGIQLMDQLAGIARQLAVAALDEAIAQGAVIGDAELALDEGDALRASGLAGVVITDFKEAVNKYKDALAKAESVLV